VVGNHAAGGDAKKTFFFVFLFNSACEANNTEINNSGFINEILVSVYTVDPNKY